MRKPVRKDYTGAGGAAVGSAVGILAIGALRQWGGIELGALESGAVMTLSSAVVSLVASYFVPLSEREERQIKERS